MRSAHALPDPLAPYRTGLPLRTPQFPWRASHALVMLAAPFPARACKGKAMSPVAPCSVRSVCSVVIGSHNTFQAHNTCACPNAPTQFAPPPPSLPRPTMRLTSSAPAGTPCGPPCKRQQEHAGRCSRRRSASLTQPAAPSPLCTCWSCCCDSCCCWRCWGCARVSAAGPSPCCRNTPQASRRSSTLPMRSPHASLHSLDAESLPAPGQRRNIRGRWVNVGTKVVDRESSASEAVIQSISMHCCSYHAVFASWRGRRPLNLPLQSLASWPTREMHRYQGRLCNVIQTQQIHVS